ncbi:MAG: type II toxin-antitoxin system Phd/YefM family antitoxin [Propionibacteriaceae bacterium]|nr:type II toxin-antitoxin system Phd/YefM family antitoxin [Propionibacteriaceae bacterium]
MIIMSLSETKDRLSAVIDEVEHRQEQVAITRNGKPAAYLVSAQQMAELEDTAFWLSYPSILESLATSQDDIAQGRTASTEDVARWIAAGMPDEDT